MNPLDPRPVLPSTHRFLRLNDALSLLPEAGAIHVQARGVGGRLGKTIPTLNPIFVEGFDFAFDPDSNVGFAMDRLHEIHVSLPPSEGCFAAAIDLEFSQFPQGLTFHLFRSPSGKTLESLMANVPTLELDEGELQVWRSQHHRPVAMCPCCRERSRMRARNPEGHAIHSILHHARIHETELVVRLPAAHCDLTTTFVPDRIEGRDGYLMVGDETEENVMQIDMRYLHALAIDTTRHDGCDYSLLRMFDPRGLITFTLMAEGTAYAGIWRNICEDHR